jgi:hypothetical protein
MVVSGKADPDAAANRLARPFPFCTLYEHEAEVSFAVV